jgi:hypothetical protein
MLLWLGLAWYNLGRHSGAKHGIKGHGLVFGQQFHVCGCECCCIVGFGSPLWGLSVNHKP